MINDVVHIVVNGEEYERLIQVLNTRFTSDPDVRHILRTITSKATRIGTNGVTKPVSTLT